MTDSPPSKNDPLYNDHPLNQEAARWLKVAGVKPDLDLPYLFQLAEWGLDHLKEELLPGDRDILRQQVEGLLYYPDQKKALDYFLNSPENPDDDPTLELEDLQQAMSPRRAAAKVLEALDLRLREDPRMKGTYPDELFCDDETRRLVDQRWKEYFPEGGVEMGDSDAGHLDR